MITHVRVTVLIQTNLTGIKMVAFLRYALGSPDPSLLAPDMQADLGLAFTVFIGIMEAGGSKEELEQGFLVAAPLTV